MKIISKLSDMIEEELNDAEKYIQCAMDKKTDYPALATTFHNLSVEELKHAKMLHDQVVTMITDYKNQVGDPPKEMMWVYDYLHKKHMEKANAIKVMQSLFNAK